jgi:hypothetical protein
MSEQQKTGSVTALGVISIVFGLIVMLLSFVPCFGSYALFLSFFPLIMGCAGYYIAKKSEQSTGLPLTGMIMSLIGFSIAGFQYYNIVRWSSSSAGTKIGLFIFIVWAVILVFFFVVNKNSDNTNSNISINTDFLNNLNLSNMISSNKKASITLNCPTCQNQLSENDVFCSSCGTNVQRYIQVTLLDNCPSCNNSITSSDVFCSGCGYNIQQYKQSYYSSSQEEKQTILLSNIQNNCSKCGNTHQVGDTFCENCGNKLI